MNLKNQGLMSMAHCLALWNQFDDNDTGKRATFLAQFRYEDPENKKGWYLYGIHTQKNIGYINSVGERAYGEDWDKATYGYTASDFTENEYAILAEKDKEFIQEGQRWWDLRRMQETKGGKHFVFCERAALPTNSGLLYPVLNDDNAYKVLWPLDKSMLDNDPSLKQNKGYADPDKCVDW